MGFVKNSNQFYSGSLSLHVQPRIRIGFQNIGYNHSICKGGTNWNPIKISTTIHRKANITAKKKRDWSHNTKLIIDSNVVPTCIFEQNHYISYVVRYRRKTNGIFVSYTFYGYLFVSVWLYPRSTRMKLRGWALAI